MTAVAKKIDMSGRRRCHQRVLLADGADRRVPPRDRCPEAQRHHHDLRRARHPDHGSRPHGPGRGDARPLLPPRAECRQRRASRASSPRSPASASRSRRRASSTACGARQRHHQLLPMILISGSSEREIVDLQQGDYEEMDQLAIAKPLCKAAFRVLHACDIGIGIARAIRAAVSGRPGGVYLDLPAQAVLAGDRCRGRREVAGEGDRCGARAAAGALRHRPRPWTS